MRISILLSFAIISISLSNLKAQEILPPALKWKGKSEKLVVKDNNPWVTYFELSDLKETPSYEETIKWFEKLDESSSLISLEVVGKSSQGRDIVLVRVSKDDDFHKGIVNNKRATLFAHAGIHSGEIDGKDAGMMLIRDIVHGKKMSILEKTNLLFIPILNVDGHERSSEYSRVNQRGPVEMGWRTNANNLNLNRDYTKIETEGIKSVLKVINKYNPDLYIDMHVTDGADYQYDITYSFNSFANYSSEINKWLINTYQKDVNEALEKNGHIPGPFINPKNGMDFVDGVKDYGLGARFSNVYGDIRHMPSILLENHSLKPYKQRVLGSYIFLEESMKTLGENIYALKFAIDSDKKERRDSVVLKFAISETTDKTIELLAVKSQRKKSELLGYEYVEWLGTKEKVEVPYYTANKILKKIKKVKEYWIPAEWTDIIEKLKLHGIAFEIIDEEKKLNLNYHYVEEYKFNSNPYEGRQYISSYELKELKWETVLPKGSIKVSTDQDLGDLVVFLLDSRSDDSFFAWGYFNSIFSRTEYIEPYIMEPLARKMLKENPELLNELEEYKKSNPDFDKNPYNVYRWFYAKSKYFDKSWKIIPIGYLD